MAHYKAQLADGTFAEFDSPNDKLTKEQVQSVIAKNHPKSTWKNTVSGIGRFGLETGGMMGGGALGALTSEATGPVGPIVGAGLGSAAGTMAADKLNQMLGVPVPQGSKPKRYGISGLMGMGGEAGGQALSGIMKTAPVQSYLAEKAPGLMKMFTDTPENLTKLKLSEKTLPKVTEKETTANYAKALEKLGIVKDPNATIDKLASEFGQSKAKGISSTLEAQGYLKNLQGKVPNSQLKDLMSAASTDVSSLTKESITKNANDLRVLQSTVKTLTKDTDPETKKGLIQEALNLRHNLDAKISYEPKSDEAAAVQKHFQGTLKEMRAQTQKLIESIPGGDIVRDADKQMQKEMAGREFSKWFKPPRFRGKGGVAQLGGLGMAPFLVSRMTGLPMMATYGAALASRSPKALGALLKGVENPGTFSQPIYQILRAMREREQQ